MKYLLIICCMHLGVSFAQELNLKGDRGGLFSLGTRTTYSMFNGHVDESNGIGVGGQFRLQFADRVNSDWFFDHLQSNIGTYASRTDYHIGWSVLFYPIDMPQARFQPYVLAGHCFDYTRLVDNSDRLNTTERWSSAVQGGLGVHCNLTDRLDLSLVGQYMLHLGNEVGAHYHNGMVDFHEETGTSMEGHLLLHLSLNYKIADLW